MHNVTFDILQDAARLDVENTIRALELLEYVKDRTEEPVRVFLQEDPDEALCIVEWEEVSVIVDFDYGVTLYVPDEDPMVDAETVVIRGPEDEWDFDHITSVLDQYLPLT